MLITDTEFELNLEKYLLVESEDIYITKNGKIIAKLSNLNQNTVSDDDVSAVSQKIMECNHAVYEELAK